LVFDHVMLGVGCWWGAAAGLGLGVWGLGIAARNL
jgi:hypothetical protein